MNYLSQEIICFEEYEWIRAAPSKWDSGTVTKNNINMGVKIPRNYDAMAEACN